MFASVASVCSNRSMAKTISTLRARRVLAGKTLGDVAQEAGISSPYLSRLERAERNASPEVAARLASALGVDPAILFVSTENVR